MTQFLNAGPADASAHILLAHGAGAAMTSPFLETMTRLLTERGICRYRDSSSTIWRRAGRAESAGHRHGQNCSIPEYKRAVEELRAQGASRQKLFIGGKSMGGRVASLGRRRAVLRAATSTGWCASATRSIRQASRSNLRTAHLEELRCPTLIVQGERDPFGSRAEVESYRLSPAIQFAWAGDGDHDLGPRGGSGFTRSGNLALPPTPSPRSRMASAN